MLVLVIDDDTFVCQLLVLLLQNLGVAAVAEPGGAAGLARYEAEGPYDLVMLDIEMPGMGGLEVMRRLQRFDPGVTIALISGDAHETAVAAVERGEAWRSLLKPISLVALRELLASVPRR